MWLFYDNEPICGNWLERATLTMTKRNLNTKKDLTLVFVEKRRDFQCDICGGSFSNSRSMKHHRLSHTEEGRSSFACPHCTFTSNWPSVLKNHIWRRHTEGHTRWPCTLCNTSFKEKGVFKFHLKRKHSLTQEEATKVVEIVQAEKSSDKTTCATENNTLFWSFYLSILEFRKQVQPFEYNNIPSPIYTIAHTLF